MGLKSIRPILAVGLILFPVAGTLSFAEAWIFLAVFAVSNSLIELYLSKLQSDLFARRKVVGPGAEQDTIQKFIQTVTFALFVMVLVGAALDYRFSWSNLGWATKILGNLLVATGFSLRFITFRENSYASAAIELMPGQTVIQTGPYAIVRHPMYLSVLLTLAGASLALGSEISLLVCFPLVFVVGWRALREEQFLRVGLPEYAAYLESVRYRLLPLIW